MGFIFIILFSASTYVWADAPVITAISGASNSDLTGTPTAYGGTAGTCVGTDNVTPCNSCTGLASCNLARIYDTLRLTVTATHTDAGNLIAIETEDNTMLSTTPHNSTTVQIPWGTICTTALGFTGGCDGATTDNKQGNIRICLDKNSSNTFDSGEECTDLRIEVAQVPNDGTWDFYGAPNTEGISDFVPYPGDEKVYIEGPAEGPIETTAGFPAVSYGSTIVAVRVFIGENNMTEATPNSGLQPAELPVVEDGNTLDNNIVDNLENNKTYWFRIGLVDKANNMVQMFPPAGTESCDTGLPCSYAATPDQVLGLLTDDINCFIATAAYGTSYVDKLNTFREFRFKRLLPTKWGRKFVESYYRYGPYAARYIHDKPLLRAATRGLLWPVYGFSLLSLKYGLWPAFFLSLFALTLIVALPLYGVRRFSRRA